MHLAFGKYCAFVSFAVNNSNIMAMRTSEVGAVPLYEGKFVFEDLKNGMAMHNKSLYE